MSSKSAYAKQLQVAYRITRNWQDAEDVVQTTHLKLLARQAAPGAVELKFPTTYAFRATINGSFQCNRKRSIQRRYEARYASELPSEYEASIKDVLATKVLLKAFCALSPQKLAVVKHVLADNSVASFQGDKNTAKAHYFLAIRRLRKYFRRHGGI